MEMNSGLLKNIARIAGVLYLFLIITGVFGVMYIPSQIIVPGDPISTAKNIISNELLFRIGVLNDIISNTIFLFLVLVLYRLLKSVNEYQAKIMFALVIVQIPFVFIMEAFNITTLMILKGDILKTFELNQRQDMAMLFTEINNYGTLSLEMFWGLWLLPFGLLVYKSEFIPHIFGILLLAGGFAYIIDSTIGIISPGYSSFVKYPTLLLVAIGEISITLWLIIKGIKIKEIKV